MKKEMKCNIRKIKREIERERAVKECRIERYDLNPHHQCDQMVRLFFSAWSFETTKIGPIMSQICQSRLNVLPNKK